jgi:hypothetical protein
VLLGISTTGIAGEEAADLRGIDKAWFNAVDRDPVLTHFVRKPLRPDHERSLGSARRVHLTGFD